MKNEENEMTDKEKAASRFEMDPRGITVSDGFKKASKDLREYLDELKKEKGK